MIVTVAGGGPAGASAAIAARAVGAAVEVFDPSPFPRQKVCGEFLSPEVVPLFSRMGLLDGFHALQPHRYSRLELHFPRVHKSAPLPELAYGLSRFALDRFLLDAAVERGAACRRERAPETAPAPLVHAMGRKFPSVKGGRYFGFKAHFTGPVNDAIELFFFRDCYVGVNAVEGGATNVCGLGPEELLRQFAFQPDELLAGFAPLRARLSPLVRHMDWLTTGPLFFRANMRDDGSHRAGRYPAGDQVSFVDPFTGTGMLAAIATGLSAGHAAATGESPQVHTARCRKALGTPFFVSSAIRWAIRNGLAARAVGLVPASLLVSWTRPRIGEIRV